MSKTTIRCAIYTRKSSDEGLDQEFNSLDAQHEACAAYIASQRHEGWKLLPARFDDGGISGGTLDRPALRRLLGDIDAGRMDMVVVYKIDRLTRSLADFAKLVDRLDAANCSFVSVTQAFNTSSSMGRLTLNVLLSFAQFEREVTAERIRDKIAASKKKGLWMGGLAPLGLDPHPDTTRRELVVNEPEAKTVRQLFELYLEHGCLNATACAAKHLGLRSKHRIFASGREQGGGVLSRGQIHKILTNPVYRGLIRHKTKTWPGAHPAIINDELWGQVQDKLQLASARRRGVGNAQTPHVSSHPTAPLLGKIRDDTGDLLTPTHTQRHGRRLRYYVSNRLISGPRDPKAWRLPAPAFEQGVATAVADHLQTKAQVHEVVQNRSIAETAEASEQAATLAKTIQAAGISAAAALIAKGALQQGTLRLKLKPDALAEAFGIDAAGLYPGLIAFDTPFTCKRRGVEMQIVAGEYRPEPDSAMIRALQNAHKWATRLKVGCALKEVAKADGFSESYVRRIVPLAMLSPRLQDAIVTGTQPLDMTLETLVRIRLPLGFEDQERHLKLSI
ncbi:MAG: recombinase family protein [Pseudomonadota bacterium]